MKILTLTFASLIVASPALADSANPNSNYQFLDLYPNGRAAYQAKWEQQGEKYQAQGYDFIERLYGDRGEGGSIAATREPPMPEAEVDTYINSIPSVTTTPAQ